MTEQYFAGLFEGEGNARVQHLDRVSKLRNGRRYFYSTNVPTIQISMTDPEPVYAIREFFGGHVNTTGRTTKGKTVYHWTASCRIALRVALALLPYCVSLRKKQQLETITHHYELLDKVLRGRRSAGRPPRLGPLEP